MNIDFLKPYNWRVGRTIIAVVVALLLVWAFWFHYLYSPWTRDGRVRVEVVDIAAQISGQVTELPVVDNQKVKKGDVLFVIDPRDYQYALSEAQATVKSRRATLDVDQEEADRRKKLGAAVSAEEVQTYTSGYDVALASYDAALAQLNQAELNLSRTIVYSPVNGYITNLHLRIGDYATPGQTKLSIVDSDSFWIAGYFEETKLPHIHEGDYAKVKLMGISPIVEGHVGSFARGIADANGAANVGLANVDPIFTWVRLAQRIPVRIDIDKVPKDVQLTAGQTCTIVISPGRHRQ